MSCELITEHMHGMSQQILHVLSLLPIDYHVYPPTTPTEFTAVSKHVITAMAHYGLEVYDVYDALDFLWLTASFCVSLLWPSLLGGRVDFG